MTEAKFQTAFGRYLRHEWRGNSACFELKLTKKNSIPFSALKDHQIRGLLNARDHMLYHKISDASYEQKPFDCFVLTKSEAWVVIMFYTERSKKEFVMIPVHKWVDELNNSTRKSLTETRAKEIGTTLLLKSL